MIKLSAKVWAELGFGLVMAWTAEVLSEKNSICVVLGKSSMKTAAIEEALDSAAISASNTSVWPPKPIFVWPISFPNRYVTTPAPVLEKPDLPSLEPSV